MKRDFSALICDLDNMPLRVGVTSEIMQKAINVIWPKLPTELKDEFNLFMVNEAAKPMTLSLACCSALIGAYDDEKNLADDERIARMELARKIHKGGEIDISPQERDMIKPLLKKRFGGIVIPVIAAELLETDIGE